MAFSQRAFPVNRRAVDTTVEAQLGKVCEEFAELCNAQYGSQGNVLEEAMDLRITVDGFIDLFPDDDVDTAYALVIEKGIKRGDWDGYADVNAPHGKYCANCAHYRKMADVDRHVCVLHNHLAHALCYCSWHKMAEGM